MLIKITAFAIVVVLFAAACKNHKKESASGNAVAAGNASLGAKTVVARDLTINKDNAYNDIFLDSAEVTRFINKEKLNDTLAAAMRSFYNARNFEYSWFTSTGLIEQAFSFHSLLSTDNEKDVFSKSLERRLDRLRVPDDSIVNIDPKDSTIVKTELQISEKFIQYAMQNHRDMTAAQLGTSVPAKKTAILALADAVLAGNNKTGDNAVENESFRLLKAPLQKYAALAKSGGWPAIDTGKVKYSLGDSSSDIVLIKKRLQASGELEGRDTTPVFTPELQHAVKAYQLSHGYKPTGDMTRALKKEMNIPALTRVQQILINMQRMRWMPTNISGRIILVNIPEFELYMDSAKNILFQMDVVVGAEGHNTTMFSGNLNEIVFSPYWNVPPSIVKKEVLPHMRRDKNYLKNHDMEITGHEDGLPVVRQLPGAKNSLGKVKFLFPNSFDIYMHDTPQKDFFNKSARDLSHGCIRLSNPVKMADYLLQDSKIWSPGKIDSAMNSGVQQSVRLKNTIPVMITYYTAWVDTKGVLHFAGDIYGHDTKMAAKMFTNPQ